MTQTKQKTKQSTKIESAVTKAKFCSSTELNLVFWLSAPADTAKSTNTSPSHFYTFKDYDIKDIKKLYARSGTEGRHSREGNPSRKKYTAKKQHAKTGEIRYTWMGERGHSLCISGLPAVISGIHNFILWLCCSLYLSNPYQYLGNDTVTGP